MLLWRRDVRCCPFCVLSSERATAELRSDAAVEDALFDVYASAQWKQAVEQRGIAVVKFDRRFAKDRILAIAALGITNHNWVNTAWGQETAKSGVALYVLAWNRTRRRVESLDVSTGLLIDDRGNQYSSEGGFYWMNEGDNSYHRHSTTLAPNAKLDGFILYPSLRPGANVFVRWYLADSLRIGDKYIDAEYDVELPIEPQKQARTQLAASVAQSTGGTDDDDLDDDIGLDDDDEELSDEWLYGR